MAGEFDDEFDDDDLEDLEDDDDDLSDLEAELDADIEAEAGDVDISREELEEAAIQVLNENEALKEENAKLKARIAKQKQKASGALSPRDMRRVDNDFRKTGRTDPFRL